MMTNEQIATYFTFLFSEGYRDLRDIGNGFWAATRPFMFTDAIIVGRMGDRSGYEDRWCYKDHAASKAALEAWDGKSGETEPMGWHRHPLSGRRRHENEEYVQF